MCDALLSFCLNPWGYCCHLLAAYTFPNRAQCLIGTISTLTPVRSWNHLTVCTDFLILTLCTWLACIQCIHFKWKDAETWKAMYVYVCTLTKGINTARPKETTELLWAVYVPNILYWSCKLLPHWACHQIPVLLSLWGICRCLWMAFSNSPRRPVPISVTCWAYLSRKWGEGLKDSCKL